MKHNFDHFALKISLSSLGSGRELIAALCRYAFRIGLHVRVRRDAVRRNAVHPRSRSHRIVSMHRFQRLGKGPHDSQVRAFAFALSDIQGHRDIRCEQQARQPQLACRVRADSRSAYRKERTSARKARITRKLAGMLDAGYEIDPADSAKSATPR